jgi:hypothetical protein
MYLNENNRRLLAEARRDELHNREIAATKAHFKQRGLEYVHHELCSCDRALSEKRRAERLAEKGGRPMPNNDTAQRPQPTAADLLAELYRLNPHLRHDTEPALIDPKAFRVYRRADQAAA